MKRIRKIVALAMIMIMSLVYPVSAAELNADNQEMEARSVNYYESDNVQFSGSFYRNVEGAGYITTYLNAVYDEVGHYYEEGVYASIVSAKYKSSTARLNNVDVQSNYYGTSSRVHDGKICGVYGINGVMYRAHMKLDEWGDPIMERLGYVYDFCIT